MFLPLDIFLEYWIEHVSFGLPYVMFTFPTRIFYRGVPGFATDCVSGVWCRGLTTCMLIEALGIILLNTYIQFNGCIFKQILGIPMGGNASPFIADLYLSWCEYCYMTKIVKTDYAMAKSLSYNCRYLDDICTVSSILVTLQNIYMTAHCCSKVAHAVTNRTPSWIFISVLLTANL